MDYEARVADLRRRIVAQANTAGPEGWLDLAVPRSMRPSGILKVPRGAFEQWAVHLSHGGHLATAWVPISPVGVKQGADDPYHTDWMLGAGLAPRDMRDDGGNPDWEELSSTAYKERRVVEERLLGFECSVLLPGPDVEGMVLQPERAGQVDWSAAVDRRPVLVLRDASPDWLADVLRALSEGGAVVVERGGGVAHLVTEARSHGKGPIVRMPDARRLYPEGCVLTVSAARGKLRLVEQERVYSTSDLAGGWMPEPVAPAARVSARPSAGPRVGFGLRVVSRGQSTADSLGMMMPCYRIEGREHTAHASFHWSGPTNSHIPSSGQPAMLVVYVSSKHRKGVVVESALQAWKEGELKAACEEAFYLAAPSEHPDSPETAEARAEVARTEHNWWRRGWAEAGISDEALLERARRAVRDRADLSKEYWDEDVEWNRDMSDDLAAYDYNFRHFDIEFRQQGLSTTIADLVIQMNGFPEASGQTVGPG